MIIGKLKRIIDLIRQKYILNKFGVFIDKGYRIEGVPFIKGEYGNITIGRNFRANSNIKANPIGYSNRCSFWTLNNGKIRIGDNVGISNIAIVAYGANVVIEDDVLIGGGGKIYSSDFHSLRYKERMKTPDSAVKCQDVIIKRGAFIGAGSIILKGVSVGEQAVIGAGTVVTRSIPANEIWAGNPAKFIKKTNDN